LLLILLILLLLLLIQLLLLLLHTGSRGIHAIGGHASTRTTSAIIVVIIATAAAWRGMRIQTNDQQSFFGQVFQQGLMVRSAVRRKMMGRGVQIAIIRQEGTARNASEFFREMLNGGRWWLVLKVLVFLWWY
jgi:hypothetical protein